MSKNQKPATPSLLSTRITANTSVADIVLLALGFLAIIFTKLLLRRYRIKIEQRVLEPDTMPVPNMAITEEKKSIDMDKQEKDEFTITRYSVLASLWAHHNATQLQWPAVILGAVFVAATLLVEKGSIANVANPEKWGKMAEVQYGAGVPLLVIGIGMMVMLYVMTRARMTMSGLEDELEQIDKDFYR